MRLPTIAATVLLVTACASTPKSPAPAPAPAPEQPTATAQQKTVVCSGGAMALIAVTRPWALKDCVSGSDQ